MKHRSLLSVYPLLLVLLFAISCGQNPPSPKHVRHTGSAEAAKPTQSSQNPSIPAKVYEVYNYIKAHHQAPEGFVGGRRFGNFEKRLPETDHSGRRITYQEWDVNPHLQHKNRGTERIITGSDGQAWYTNNHYQSFTAIN